MLQWNRNFTSANSKPDERNKFHPNSECSSPCPFGFEAVVTSPSCCWYCDKCSENQRIVIINSVPKCLQCPTSENFTWPDSERKVCLPIPISFISLSRLDGRLLFTLDTVVLISAIVIGLLYSINHNNRLIKASSRELSFVMLGGHVVTCFLGMTFTVEPSAATCIMSLFGFYLSFTVTYAPLLVKTNRIYRIFIRDMFSNRKPPLISSSAQIAIVSVLIIMHASTVVCLFSVELCVIIHRKWEISF